MGFKYCLIYKCIANDYSNVYSKTARGQCVTPVLAKSSKERRENHLWNIYSWYIVEICSKGFENKYNLIRLKLFLAIQRKAWTHWRLFQAFFPLTYRFHQCIYDMFKTCFAFYSSTLEKLEKASNMARL